MVYEREKAMLGKIFKVKREWKIGNCKMKIGDVLEVVDYGSGLVSNYVVFKNKRFKNYQFHTATWLFIRNTKPLK